jgi:Transposase DDE domain
MVQGIVCGLAEYVKIVEEIHFTHIRKRMIGIKPIENDDDNDNEEPITLVVDASGLTVSKKGDHIEVKWIRKKKEFKLHIAADAKSKKVVSFRITRGNVHHAKKFCPLIRESSKKYNIDKVCADKAQDNRRNFNLLERLDVEPVIAIRNNASTRERGCPLRREEILLIKKLGYQRWKQMKDPGRRWIAEIVFSSIKRVLGEDLFSKKFGTQKVEVSMKILLCKLVF